MGSEACGMVSDYQYYMAREARRGIRVFGTRRDVTDHFGRALTGIEMIAKEERRSDY
ncbi:hypothetical protein BKA10_001822 [Microbacterium invictum]|uniref:Uncharacterized protein n=1 Tax=Microbacterium invictum TaxID=515415 RepID=A0AA40VN54_9MICO|nr:hypothetical protein [Microbacterium invictum]